MGKSTPSPPPAPDPYATASAQGTSNANTATAQAALNNANTYSPYGSTKFQVTGQQEITNPDGTKTSVPTYTQTNSLSPNQQMLLGQNEALGIQTNEIAADAQNSIGWTLKNPLQANQIARVQSSVGGQPQLQNGYASGQLQTGYDAGGQVRTGYDTGPSLQSGYASGGPVQRLGAFGVQSASAPTAFGQTATGVQGDVSLRTDAPTAFGATQNGVSYFQPGDFSAARNSATNAVLQRLQPSMAQQQESLDARLANQGTAQGSSAYNAAQLQQNQANNDLRLGAVATGDAEQQALFGQQATSNQLFNNAQAQDYGQQLGRGQFAQAGIAQNNQASLDMANFHNAAQMQDFGEQQARGQFAQAGTAANNAAIGANNQAALGFGAFNNAAQAQEEGQNAARAAFFNQSVGQQNEQNAALAAFGNAAQGQQNAQNANAAAFGNAAVGQQAQQNAALAAFGNAAATQGYQNRLAGAAFNNQASAQQLAQSLAIANQQINQISALRSGGQVANYQGPNYQSAQLDQTPISADVYQTAAIQNQQYMAQLQNQAQNQAAMGSAIGGLAGGIGRKSDRRLKTDVRRVARARNGLAIYRYRMPGEAPGWHLGFMADEVALIHPGAVWTDPGDGFARVDYEKAVA